MDLAGNHGWDASDLDFYVVHAGGPRILDDLSKFLQVDPHAFRFSRATLTEYGNIASAVVLDALRRLFDEGGPPPGARTAGRLRPRHHRGDVPGPLGDRRRDTRRENVSEETLPQSAPPDPEPGTAPPSGTGRPWTCPGRTSTRCCAS